MLSHLPLAAILVVAASFGAAAVEDAFPDLPNKPALCLVPEMNLIPELDTWDACEPDAFADAAPAFNEAWGKLAPWASAHLTPEAVRALSRWAKPEMEKYSAVPDLAKHTFHPVTSFKKRSVVLYEAVIDGLPVHSQLVTRQLIAYVLFSTETHSILRVTFTIRGHVEE